MNPREKNCHVLYEVMIAGECCYVGCLQREKNIVKPGYDKVPRDCENLFALTRCRYIIVLFLIFYY